MAFGVLLIALGVVLLLESLGITHASVSEWWPAILIAVGAAILYERVRRALRRRK